MLARLRESLPVKLFQAYGESNAGNYAAALAFNAFTTMFPVLLGVLAVIGLAVRDPKLEAEFQTTLVAIFPGDAQSQVLQALQGVKQNAGLLGVVAIAGSIWTGTNLFASMEFALDQVFGSKQRDTVRQKVMGVVMMVVFVAAVIAAVAVNNAAAFVPFMPVTGFLVGWAILSALLVAIYRLVPNRTFKFRDVWPGALLAGFLIEVLTLAFPLYSRLSHGFTTYGRQFALFLLLAAWFGLLSQLLLLGAVVNRLRLGQPEEEGLIAAPADKSEHVPAPVTAIEAKQERLPRPGRPAGPAAHRRSRGGPATRLAGLLLGAGLVAAALLRSRRSPAV
jgi:membrane protein